MPQASELQIDTTADATQMANAMFGSGVTVTSASYTGAASASGIYSGGDVTAPLLTPSDTGVILSTGNAVDVTNTSGEANVAAGTTTNHGTAGDADLNSIAGATTFDAAIFEATFVPDGPILTMQFVFSSEEYLEYVNSGFNDAIGVMVNGTAAKLGVGNVDVTINTINNVSNTNLYVDNPATAETVNTEMDGLTVTLTLKAPVTPGEANTIKIAIADGGDGAYDSNLLIVGDSLQTDLIALDDALEVVDTKGRTFDLTENDSSVAGGELTIIAINGIPVSAGDVLVLNTGEEITLNADGSVTIASDGDVGTNAFSYTVEDVAGNTDTAFVEVTTVPCFVAGSMVRTLQGAIPVEALKVGDLVWTRDNGFQPVRWIGYADRRAIGLDAPILFEAGALGAHGVTRLSANHRVLWRGGAAQMLFGESEVLIRAQDLVDDQRIRRVMDYQPVRYVHVLFDRHEVICADGMESESYHPGQETIGSFSEATRQEVLRLMPSLDPRRGFGYGATARRALRRFEARALLGPGYERASA